jgi:membrane associated rhomboid family serine protease
LLKETFTFKSKFVADTFVFLHDKITSMGEADRSHRNERFEQKRSNKFLLGATNNALTALFAINVIFFLTLMVVQVGMFAGLKTPGYFQDHIVQWFELPSSLTKLSTRPWTLFTYMFTEIGPTVFNGVANMFWLWTFGYILQTITGNDKIIPIYIYGGIAGAVFFILAHYILPPIYSMRGHAGLLGANASVMAVAIATTALAPGYRLFTQIRGGIPIWVLTMVYILIDFAGVATSGAAFSLSHLGGALAGYLFVVFLRKGKDGSVWMNKTYNYVMHMFDPKPKTEASIKNEVFYNTGNRQPFVKTPNVTQKRVDEILDKINQKGYHFLTDEEKAFLEKASKNDDLL